MKTSLKPLPLVTARPVAPSDKSIGTIDRTLSDKSMLALSDKSTLTIHSRWPSRDQRERFQKSSSSLGS
jgi:hypothetical protein